MEENTQTTKVSSTQVVTQEVAKVTQVPVGKPEITYDDFLKLDLRVAKVIAAQEIEGADKLLKITLDVGELGERIVAAGIKQWYSPEEMVGKTVTYLANLAPRKLRGVVSQGMIIAAGDETAILIVPQNDSKPGTVIR